MKPSKTVDINTAKRILSYNPETGEFKRLDGRKKCETTSRYKSIMVAGVRVASHRLAWAMHYGKWPDLFIDHIDGDTLNNCITNLRQCTSSENYQNRKLCKFNKFGFTGVSFHKATGKFVAQIQVDKKRKHLGIFNTAEEAAEAYRKSKRMLHHFQPELRES